MTYDHIVEHVLSAFKHSYPDEDIDLQSDFFDLGGDSLILVNLCLSLSEKVNLDIHPSSLLYHPTVEELAAAIKDLSEADAALKAAN